LKHLILCREYPPAPYPAGGIGTYASHIARLLADAGETVHLIAQRWDGAPEPLIRSCEGRLTIHRIPLDEPVWSAEAGSEESEILRALAASTCPSQVFSWQAARYAERLIEQEGIDVMEAQEWEAPLYYLQLRRGLGLGPDRQPPCIVHLHSPTQMIFEHNEWDKTLVDYLPLRQFEEFTIRAADSLVCPSYYLARGVATLFDLEPGSVTVVRYPMGETPALARTPEAWARDAICYVGRLELRKGVVEWIDAAIQVAATNHSVSFDFFGSDTPLDGGSGESVRAFLMRRIPRALRRRFHFHGSQPREQLLQSLSTFSIAVVPSRWENLPYTCIEAMATGLPVLVSPNGGMAELIADGKNGWVARDGSADGLAEALTRALSVLPAERAAMGARATEAVRRMCANDVVVAQHLEHRSKLVRAGVNDLTMPPEARLSAPPGPRGIGFVVTCSEAPERLASTVASIRLQTKPVPCVIVLDAALRQRAGAEARGVDQVIYIQNFSPSTAADRGFEALLALWPNLRAVAILDRTMRLASSFASTCETAFAYRPSAGVVAPWALRTGRLSNLDAGSIPLAAPIFWHENLPYGCAIRVEAVRSPENQRWDAISYPETLLFVEETHRAGKLPRRRYSGMALIQNPSAGFAFAWFLAAPMREKARWISRIVLHPRRIVRWMGWQLRQRVPKPSMGSAPHRAQTKFGAEEQRI
jgi:glycosyltransferase involved in cell wall biosynthesis